MSNGGKALVGGKEDDLEGVLICSLFEKLERAIVLAQIRIGPGQPVRGNVRPSRRLLKFREESQSRGCTSRKHVSVRQGCPGQAGSSRQVICGLQLYHGFGESLLAE